MDKTFIHLDTHLSGPCIASMQFWGSQKCPEEKQKRKKTKTFINAAVFIVAAAAVQNRKKIDSLANKLDFWLEFPI